MKDTTLANSFWDRAGRQMVFPGLLLVFVAIAWLFPRFWYEKPKLEGIWLVENQEISGWQYEKMPLDESVEEILTSDEASNGYFKGPNGQEVRVFLSSRLGAVENDLQLFAHSPDVCWKSSGFERVSVQPTSRTFQVQGMPMVFERRIYKKGNHHELVYFGGMLDCQPLPFRLAWDKESPEDSSSAPQVSLRSLQRVKQAFLEKKTLSGPKQFVRFSTAIHFGNVESAEKTLQTFLPQWLRKQDFRELKKEKEISHKKSSSPPA